jgi:putative membrane protein
MKKALFQEKFRTQLWDTIAEIEQHSCVEIVVILRSHSASYIETSYMWGALLAFITFTYLMFSPAIYGDYLLYTSPLFAGIVGGLLASKVPFLQRIFVSKTRQRRNVEIMARALFQKGGIRHTSAKIGVLIYGSLFEKTVCVLPDRGVTAMIPQKEWQRIETGFQHMFTSQNPADAFLVHLRNCQPIFSSYLPLQEDDINELPDKLEVAL